MVARVRGIQFVVRSVDETVVVYADRQILAAAVAGLLQNAFKFTHPGHTVRLDASVAEGRVLIEVEDQCGGLSPEETARLLQPVVARSRNRARFGAEGARGAPVAVRKAGVEKPGAHAGARQN